MGESSAKKQKTEMSNERRKKKGGKGEKEKKGRKKVGVGWGSLKSLSRGCCCFLNERETKRGTKWVGVV